MDNPTQCMGMTLPHTAYSTFPCDVDKAPNERLFTRLAVENVATLWPQIKELLKLDKSIGVTHTIDDIHKLIMSHRVDVWIQFFKPFSLLEAIVITEFVHYPRGLFLRAWITCALPTARLNVDKFYDLVSSWAFNNDCKGMLAVGRIGWMRKVPKAKYCYHTMMVLFNEELN